MPHTEIDAAPRADVAEAAPAAVPYEGVNMGIGLGVVLLVLGLILVLRVVQFDLQFIDDVALGWIFLIAGILAIVLALIMNKQRSQTRHVEERRYDGPPR
jgi:vacuolar-type H+-ATPase subunit I/STV1